MSLLLEALAILYKVGLKRSKQRLLINHLSLCGALPSNDYGNGNETLTLNRENPAEFESAM